MKYLLVNIDEIEEVIDDITGISNEDYEKLAEQYGFVVEGHEDFQSRFNAEHFETRTHQLRIISDE